MASARPQLSHAPSSGVDGSGRDSYERIFEVTMRSGFSFPGVRKYPGLGSKVARSAVGSRRCL
jgi:hypothetical protein